MIHLFNFIAFKQIAGSDFHRIHPFLVLGNMTGFSFNFNIDFAGAGHHFIFAGRYDAFRDHRPQMRPEHAYGIVFFHDSRAAYEMGAAWRLFAGLKDEQHVMIQLFIKRVQALRESEQHGHMAVMAAGMHAADVTAPEFARCRLGNGQRVHIGAENYRFLFSGIKKSGYRIFDRMFESAVEFFEFPRYILAC